MKLDQIERGIMQRVLSWLLIGQRQLHTEELLNLAGAKTITKATLLCLCFDFVVYDSTQDMFKFSHLSVREFLETKPDEYGLSVLHDLAASACISRVMDLDSYEKEDYASLYWLVHAEARLGSGDALSCNHQLDKLFCSRPNHLDRWSDSVQRSISSTTERPREPVESRLAKVLAEHTDAIVITASYGLTSTLRSLLCRIDRKSLQRKGKRKLAIIFAAEYGHMENVRILSEKGADVNAKGGKYGNALQAASLGGHKEMVELLIEKGAREGSGIYDMVTTQYRRLMGEPTARDILILGLKGAGKRTLIYKLNLPAPKAIYLGRGSSK
jgi:hypothetical protein